MGLKFFTLHKTLMYAHQVFAPILPLGVASLGARHAHARVLSRLALTRIIILSAAIGLHVHSSRSTSDNTLPRSKIIVLDSITSVKILKKDVTKSRL